MNSRAALATLLVGGLALAGCANDAIEETSARLANDRDTTLNTIESSYTVTGSVNQVFVLDATPNAELQLVDADGEVVDKATTDDQGSLIFRQVPAGAGFRVITDGETPQASEPVTVLDIESSLPPQSFYEDQELVEGFQYITTRDGTTLSAAVYLPPGDGPFPTVVEYSGYDPSNPTKDMVETVAELGIDPESICETITIICATPAQPSSVLAAANGYAVVAVNIRGTGCSGGAYDFFEPLQLTDGYDVIETVAAQDWVRGKVGMVGLSYPGISQLFVASTQPPNLAAIAPMSVYDDTALGVLAPGGLYNTGFALSWAENVLDGAEPLGQGWEQQVVDEGDTICADNQRMRGQNVDAVAKARSSTYYEPDLADPVNIAKFASEIEVPVFMTGSWQDEQTGPRFVNLWDKLTNAPVTKFFAMNGAHADGLGPETLVEWKLFLDFYVAGERQPIPGFLRTFGPTLLADTFKSTMEFPPDRLLEGDFDTLRAQYEAEPDITIFWDRGGDPANPGAVTATGRTTLASWADRSVKPTRWFFGPDGSLDAEEPPRGGGWSTWTANPERASSVTLPGDLEGQAFDALPEYRWEHDAAGEAAVFVTEPLRSDAVLLGGGSADLWVRTDATNADLGITLSEVRPDGKETFIQVGMLRADIRKPGPEATELDPAHTFLEADAADLPPGVWTEVRVPILPVGHVLRAGSRLRVSVHTPGGDQPRWAFDVDSDARPSIDIGHDAEHPSSIVLPVGNGIGGYSKALPPCPSLRGQPCRTYVAYDNESTTG